MLLIYTLMMAAVGASALPPVGSPSATEGSSETKLLQVHHEESNCGAGKPGEITVCGQRRELYRIEREIMAVEDASDGHKGDAAPTHDSANLQKCVPYGPNGCPGQDVIPVSGIALTAAQAALLAAQGEDWRDAFRTKPNAYRVYTDAKKRVPKPSVKIGLGIQP